VRPYLIHGFLELDNNTAERASYKDDVDLVAKLNEWENVYNFHRQHRAFAGKTPYEALREKL